MKRDVIWSFAAIALSCCLFEMRNKAAYGAMLMIVFLLYSLIVNREQRRIIYFCTALPVWLYLLYRTSYGFEYIHHPKFRMIFLIDTVWLLGGYWGGFFLSKWKAVQAYFYLVLLIIISFALSVLCNTISWRLSFMVTGMIYLAAPYIARRFLHQKRYVPWVIVAPVMLTALEAWLGGTINSLPLTLVPLCSVGMYYLIASLHRRRVFQTLLIAAYLFFLGYGWFAGMESFYRWVAVQRCELPPDTYPECAFYTMDGQAVTPADLKGKIVVFDFWSTSCGVCFREFPEYDRVYQKYRNRDDIAMYAVNLPFKRDTRWKLSEPGTVCNQ
jgi:thiol-disulfide isomerase/thioredoxin